MLHLFFVLSFLSANDQTYNIESNSAAIRSLEAIREDLEYFNKWQINPFFTSRMCQYSVDFSDSTKIILRGTKCRGQDREYIIQYYYFNNKRELFDVVRYDSLTVDKKFVELSRWHMKFRNESGGHDFRDSVIVETYTYLRNSRSKRYYSENPSITGRFKYRPVVHADSVKLFRDPLLTSDFY